MCVLCPFWQRQHNPHFINNKKTVGQNPMEEVFIEEADIIYGRPAFIVLSAQQTSHHFCVSEKKKDQQPCSYPVFCSDCLHRAPGSSPRVRRVACFYAWRCKQVGVCNTWASKATYLFCYVKCVTVRLRVKPTAAKCLSQNRVVWLFYSLKNQVIKTCYKWRFAIQGYRWPQNNIIIFSLMF